MIYWVKCFGKIQIDNVDSVPSSSHRVTVSSADRRLVTVDWRGRKPCCFVVSSESWGKWDSSFSLRIVSRILQTTDVRLTGLNCLGFVVRGLFTTGVTIARDQASGTWAVWIERLAIPHLYCSTTCGTRYPSRQFLTCHWSGWTNI